MKKQYHHQNIITKISHLSVIITVANTVRFYNFSFIYAFSDKLRQKQKQTLPSHHKSVDTLRRQILMFNRPDF